MINVVLEYVPADDYSNNSGQAGWRIQGWPEAATPFASRGVMHDLLEHFQDDANPLSAESELMAAGAALYLNFIGTRPQSPTWIGVVANAVLDDMECQPDGHALEPAPDFSVSTEVLAFVQAGISQAVTAPLASEFVGWICHGYTRAVDRYASYGGAEAMRTIYARACQRIEAREPPSRDCKLLLVIDPIKQKVATRLYQ